MGWNYRILASEHNDEIYFQVHEVYYDAKDMPDGYTKNAISVGGEDLDSIKSTLQKMEEALLKPILWSGDKFPQEYE